MRKKTILKNGLRIIIDPQKETEAITILVLVGTGSKYETKEKGGISHFLEHLFFKGTEKRTSVAAVAETLDEVGGVYNAFTGEEYTGYFVKIECSHFDLALDVVSDIFLHSKLKAKEIKKEKGVIFEEINMYFDNPMSYVQTLWSRLLYGDQPAGRDIAGTRETVAKISRGDLLDYMKNQYVSENTVISIAGKINGEEAFAKAKRYFSKIRAAAPKGKPKVIEEQTRPDCLLHKRATDQAHLCLGVRGYNIFHSQRYVQDLLGTILGGMMSSRLFIEIRDKLGMAYYIKTEVSSDSDTGFLVTRAGVDSGRTEKAISVILREYKKISRQRIPAAELKKAKENIKGKMALSLESSDARAFFYGLQEIVEKEIFTPEQIYAKIDKVSADDILRVGRDIFRPEKLNLALIGPFKDKTKFQKLLNL